MAIMRIAGVLGLQIVNCQRAVKTSQQWANQTHPF